MAAPLKGDAARTEVASTRITKAEKAQLIATFGSVAKGLRAILSASFAAGQENHK